MENSTTKFQVQGTTIFLLEETGQMKRTLTGLEPQYRNKVMMAVQPCSKNFTVEQCTWLAEQIAHALNLKINDQQSAFRALVVGDVEEDDDDTETD